MELKNSPDPVPCHPSWIPASGHALRHVGIHFNAVRAIGLLGEEIAYEVMQFTDFQAGPIVRSGIGERSMYFRARHVSAGSTDGAPLLALPSGARPGAEPPYVHHERVHSAEEGRGSEHEPQNRGPGAVLTNGESEQQHAGEDAEDGDQSADAMGHTHIIDDNLGRRK
ncbi:hypothetical protein [Streptomyces sp. gb14]|uniref:hypothetical protein n=1 Tax=Streptomyces sp. gb14 TaxID=1827753 RepID=UPI00211D9C24|nr:hypothetical protein [Streptomyces sp. gb14]